MLPLFEALTGKPKTLLWDEAMVKAFQDTNRGTHTLIMIHKPHCSLPTLTTNPSHAYPKQPNHGQIISNANSPISLSTQQTFNMCKGRKSIADTSSTMCSWVLTTVPWLRPNNEVQVLLPQAFNWRTVPLEHKVLHFSVMYLLPTLDQSYLPVGDVKFLTLSMASLTLQCALHESSLSRGLCGVVCRSK